MEIQDETEVRNDVTHISEDNVLKYASKTLRNMLINKDIRISTLKVELAEARNRCKEQEDIIRELRINKSSDKLLKSQGNYIVKQQDVIKDLKDDIHLLQKQLKDLQKSYEEREVAIKEIIDNNEAKISAFKQCQKCRISVDEDLRCNQGKNLQQQIRNLTIKLERAETIKIEQREIIKQLNWKIDQLMSEDYDMTFQPVIYRKRDNKGNRIYMTSFESVFLRGDIDLLLLTPEHTAVLKGANIHTVYDFVTAPREKLLSLDNITNSTLIKFNGKLRPRNLHLEMNLDYDEEKGVYVEISQKG